MDTPITRGESLKSQTEDKLCKSLLDKLETSGSQFDIEHNGYLVRRFSLDGCPQKFVPGSLRSRDLHLLHYHRHAGHTRATRLYYIYWWNFAWPHMAHDVYRFGSQCTSCVKTPSGLRKERKYLKRFPGVGSLEFVAIALQERLSKTEKGYKYVHAIIDRFSKLTRAISL